MHDGQVRVSAHDVARAIRDQVPALAGLLVRRIDSAGTVIAPYRLGDRHVVRVPLVPTPDDTTKARLQAQARHAGFLADHVPVEVPQLIHLGEPFTSYRGHWTVWTWSDGSSLDRTEVADQLALADDVAALLRTFHALPTHGQTWNGIGRGARPLTDTEWVRTSIQRSAHLMDAAASTDVWERALAAPAQAGPATYIHGDPMPGNLIVRDGRLAALIDIAEPSFGDPASDLAPAWTLFDEPARSRFRATMGLDDAAWERGRGWAFEMAIGGLHYYEHTNTLFAAQAARTLRRLLETAS